MSIPFKDGPRAKRCKVYSGCKSMPVATLSSDIVFFCVLNLFLLGCEPLWCCFVILNLSVASDLKFT